MKIKICGLKYVENLLAIANLAPHYIGFIFYEQSPRFVTDLEVSIIDTLPKQIYKVGVFVNASVDYILDKVKEFNLDFVQLHGDETIEDCKQLKVQNIAIIKAFSIHENFDFDNIVAYQNYCQYFLFDTATKQYGGSGETFNWKILQQYQLQTPFFLSGGIGLENIDEALVFQHPQLLGFDLNSKLEDAPGLKNIQSTKNIIQKIRNYGTV